MTPDSQRYEVEMYTTLGDTSYPVPPEIQYDKYKICPKCGAAMMLSEGHYATPMWGRSKWCKYNCMSCTYQEQPPAYEEDKSIILKLSSDPNEWTT